MAKTKPLSEGYKANFETLELAFKNGDVCLISGRIKSTGEDVAIIAALSRDSEGMVTVTPFGHLCPDNPYEYYEDPTQE